MEKPSFESNKIFCPAYPIGIFNNILSYRGQRGPFAVVYCFGGASFVYVELANFASQQVPGIYFVSTYVTVCGSGVEGWSVPGIK